MSERAHLCLDMGGTGTRAALLAPDGTGIARSTAGPGAVSLGVDVSAAVVSGVHAALCPDLPAGAVTLTIGLAGIGLRARVAALAARLSAFARVTIVGDGYGALLAATGGRPGALIAIGTGVAAMRLLPDGRFRTLSGWGFPAGDAGSGAWIGMQAVAALMRHLDRAETGAPMGAPLARDLAEALGGSAAAIMARTAGAPAHVFAGLVPRLVAAQDDPAARAILGAAAAEIAAVGRALWDQGPGAVALTGGLAPVLAPLVRQAAPERDWTTGAADPLVGLGLLARGLAPPERLVARPGLSAPDY